MELGTSPQPNELTVEAYDYLAFAAMRTDAETYQTIRGTPVADYLFRGLIEEHAETIEEPKLPDKYRRIDVVDGIAIVEDGIDLKRHQKEFGDVTWYVSRYLESQDLTIGDALHLLFRNQGQVFDGTFAHLDEVTDEWAREVTIKSDEGEDLSVAKQTLDFYNQAFEDMCETAERACFAPYSWNAKKELLRCTGILLLSMSWIVKNCLRSSMAEVAVENIQKITDRNKNGRVFKSANQAGVSDDR